MGIEYSKREVKAPVTAAAVALVTANATALTDLAALNSSDVALIAALSRNNAYQLLGTTSLTNVTPSATKAALPALNPAGTTVINSTGGTGTLWASLPSPVAAGDRKNIYVTCLSTADVKIQNYLAHASSAAGFFNGTTGQCLAFTTADAQYAKLVAVSTSAWRAVELSGPTIVGTTA